MILTSLFLMPIFSCSGTRPTNLGVKDSRFAACPSTPNCVSSDDAAAAHLVPPFQLLRPAGDAWRAASAAVAGLPRTKIITQTDDYLHAECSSAVFGFVDDLELHLRAEQNLIAARSAARLGYSDLDINRKRVESLRLLLRHQELVK